MTIKKRIAAMCGVLFFATATVLIMRIKSINFNSYKPLIQTEMGEALGRTLSIEGNIELDIGFSSRLIVNNINISNVHWGSHPTMITVQRAEAEVALFPLLFGNIHISRLILLELSVLLEKDSEGNGNWQFQTTVDNDENKTKHQDSELPRISHILLSKVNISYKDGMSGKQSQLWLDSIEAKTESPDNILNLQITGSINKEPLKITAQLDKLDQLITEKASLIQATVKYGGDVSKESNKNRKYEDKKRSKLKVQINGKAHINDSGYTLEALQITLNENLLSGRVDYDLSDNTPMLTAELYFETFDLHNFPTITSTTLSKRENVFSAEKIDFSMLEGINTNIIIEGKKIIGSRLTLGNLALTTKLDDGLLKIQPFKVDIGGSTLNNNLVLNIREKTPKVQFSSKGKQFNLGEMLRKTDTTDLLVGAPTNIDISLQSSGDSPAMLAGNLSGHILVDVGRGRVSNQYLNLIGADLTSNLLNALDPSTAEKESYTQLECAVINLRPRNGIITYDKKVAMETDRMTIISSGTINLKQEKLAIGIAPKPRKDAKGLRLGVGNLFSTAQLQGTLADPKLGVHAANTAKAGARLYGALATGGTSLLLESLFDKITEDPHPCQTAKEFKRSNKKSFKKSILRKFNDFKNRF